MDQEADPTVHTPEEQERLRKIEEELAKVAASDRFSDPEEDDRLSARLTEIETQARIARASFEPHTPEGSQGAFVTPESGRSLGRGLQIAYAIIGVPLVGFGVGWLIDRQAHSGNLWAGLLTIGGAAVAVVYAAKQASQGE